MAGPGGPARTWGSAPRVGVLSLVVIATLLGDAAPDTYEVVTSMAAALAEQNVPAFEKALSKSMAGREQLVRNVRAMIVQAEVTSSVTPMQDDGDDSRHVVVLDWSLQLKQRGASEQIVQRRETVTVQFAREGKRWVVLSITPATLFGPPNFR